MNRIADELQRLRERGLYRTLSPLPAGGGRIAVPGGTLLNFSSNDYLALSAHPELTAAAAEAVRRLGCSASASRLMSGHLDLHAELERELAALLGAESALCFGSGFLANLGVLSVLLGRGDTAYADRLNHASLIDGVRLAGAESRRYRHKDTAHLGTFLEQAAGPGRRVIVTDSVFSMDGDLAPVAELARLARQHGAVLAVDEAHAIGIFGPGGGGVCSGLTPEARPAVILGTPSKALGSYGGFCACSAALRELLINRARPFIYSTALPPAALAGALAAVRRVRREPKLGARLLDRVRFFHARLLAEGFLLPAPESQILPLPVRGNERALEFARRLRARAIVATAIRAPTVPAGAERLRLSVTLAHTEADLAEAAAALGKTARELGVL